MDTKAETTVKTDKVYILLLTYNNWQDTIECLESICQNTYRNFQVVCVDNASTDGSEQKIKEWAAGSRTVSSKFFQYNQENKPLLHITYDKKTAENGGAPEREKSLFSKGNAHPLVYVRTESNLGYGGGNNVGMRYAVNKRDSKYIWVLNNDTVIEKDALASLVSCAENDQKTGMVGSKLLYYDRPTILQSAGGGYISSWLGNTRLTANNQKDDGRWDSTFEPDYICGASLFIKTAVLEEIGFMDDEYFLYWEDVDWGMAARKKQYHLVYCPESRVWHKEGGTSGGITRLTDYYWVRNGLFFIKRFYPVLLPFIPFSYLLKYTLIRILKNQPLHFNAFLSGLRDFLAGKKGRRSTPQ